MAAEQAGLEAEARPAAKAPGSSRSPRVHFAFAGFDRFDRAPPAAPRPRAGRWRATSPVVVGLDGALRPELNDARGHGCGDRALALALARGTQLVPMLAAACTRA